MILKLLLKKTKNSTLPAQQINSENLTHQQGFGVSQHFTLCGCSDSDLRALMLDLLHCEIMGMGRANEQVRPKHPAPQGVWLVGPSLQKLDAGTGSVQSSRFYCKHSSEQIKSLPSSVSIWKVGKKKYDKFSFHILTASNLITDHLSTFF